jgi:hypothetical protein
MRGRRSGTAGWIVGSASASGSTAFATVTSITGHDAVARTATPTSPPGRGRDLTRRGIASGRLVIDLTSDGIASRPRLDDPEPVTDRRRHGN